MIRTALFAGAAGLVFAILLAAPARAQAQGKDQDSNYTFYHTEDGYLRLETHSGQVSLCSRRPTGWQCQTVPDKRAAIEAEIARLQAENAALKKELLAHDLPLPGGMRSDPQATKPAPPVATGPEQRLDQVIAAIGRVWRRLVDFVVSVRKDFLQWTS